MRRRSGFGWLDLIVGIAFLCLGLYTFVNPGRALSGMVMLYGLLAVIAGIEDILMYVRVEKYTGFGPTMALITGILSVMAGMMLLVYPNAGKWILSLLFPVWFIAHCISRLCHLEAVRITAGKFMYYLTMALNIIGLALGVMMVFRPFTSLLSVSYIVGFYLVALGIDNIAMGISRMGSRR